MKGAILEEIARRINALSEQCMVYASASAVLRGVQREPSNVQPDEEL